jgi:hypothetical protein
LNGQNAARPVRARIAGNNSSIEASASAMPVAATGPRPRVDGRSEKLRQASATITVPALAATGHSDARQATRIASYGSSCRRSSSRNRDTISSA